jgi:hypothetical protein
MSSKMVRTIPVQNAANSPVQGAVKPAQAQSADLRTLAETTPVSAQTLLRLQRTVGNRALQRLLVAQPGSTPGELMQRSDGGPLSQSQVTAAVAYNEARGYDSATIGQIQEVVGVNASGIFDEQTAQAVGSWQAQHGLKVDGKVGPMTLAQLVPPEQETPAEPAPETAPASEPSASEPEEGGLVESVIGGLGDAWDSLVGGATNAWEGVVDFFGGGETAPAQEPTENEPAQPEPSELDQIMMKERLTPEEIGRARELIAQVTDEKARGDLYAALQAKVEYANQRDNASVEDIARSGRQAGDSAADVMCNLTSLAMALSYLGVPNPDPTKQYEDALEDIRVKEGFAERTNNMEGWGAVAKHVGVTVSFDFGNVKEGKEWYQENVDPKMREGNAVMMSITGHIVRAQAVTDAGLVVDDPYGRVILKAGSGRGWEDSNDKEGEGANAGEDNVWDWEAVKAHNMQWIAFLKK